MAIASTHLNDWYRRVHCPTFEVGPQQASTNSCLTPPFFSRCLAASKIDIGHSEITAVGFTAAVPAGDEMESSGSAGTYFGPFAWARTAYENHPVACIGGAPLVASVDGVEAVCFGWEPAAALSAVEGFEG